MKNYDFDTVINRRNTGSAKWDLYGDDVLPLWVADMDFPVLDEIQEAIMARSEHPFFGYQQSDPEVMEAICAWVHDRHGWHIYPEDILLVPGVVSGINWVASVLIEHGEAIAFQTPVYYPFYHVAAHQSIKQRTIPFVRYDDKYEIDFNFFEQEIEKETRVFLLCNPHNPIGKVFRKKELMQIGQICAKHNVFICSDEIHCDIVYSNKPHTPIASLSKELSDRTITLMAPSKTFNIPGLHFSFAICQNEAVRERLEKGRQGMLAQPNILAQTAAKAAYQHGENWLNALLKYLQSNRNYLHTKISKSIPEINYHKPDGTYLAWLDCGDLDLGDSPSRFFRNQAKVALNDGKVFSEKSAHFVRLNFGCPRSILDEALERMIKAIKEYRR